MAASLGALAEAREVVDSALMKTESHQTESPSPFTPDAEKEDAAVTELAKQMTHYSVKDGEGHYINPFHTSDDPKLDPRSKSFIPRAWAKNVVGITARDPERYPEKTIGVSYQNLNVHGFGRPTDYQKTFGNYPLGISTVWQRITGKGKHKIQILRDFDGLVKSGEMLVVLGRPGSGCSTLLKTLSGETYGFFVDAQSQVNYQGQLITDFMSY